MAENLTTRVGRIVSGSANAVVNALENAAPDLLMEEAIREVEKAVDEVRTELGQTLARKHLAGTRLADANNRHADLSDQIELALAEKRDDLAEAAVAQQLDIEAQIPIIETTIADAGDQENELEGYVAALQARRREMTDELDRFRKAKAAGAAATEAGGDGGAGSGARSRSEKASHVFDRVMARSTDVPGNGANLQSAAQLAELEGLSRSNRIRERMAEARARLES